MSKVKYYYTEEYLCQCLDEIRRMHETRDYSSLMAVTERIQAHANKMEDAIARRFVIKNILDKDIKPSKKIEQIYKSLDLKEYEDD